LASAGFKQEIPSQFTPSMLVDKMYTDKKVRSGKIRFVLMDGIGKIKQFQEGSYSAEIPEELLYETIAEMAFVDK